MSEEINYGMSHPPEYFFLTMEENPIGLDAVLCSTFCIFVLDSFLFHYNTLLKFFGCLMPKC